MGVSKAANTHTHTHRHSGSGRHTHIVYEATGEVRGNSVREKAREKRNVSNRSKLKWKWK